MIGDSSCTVDDGLTLWCASCKAQSSSYKSQSASPHPPRSRKAFPPKWRWTGGCHPAQHRQKSWNVATLGTSRSGCHYPVCPSERKKRSYYWQKGWVGPEVFRQIIKNAHVFFLLIKLQKVHFCQVLRGLKCLLLLIIIPSPSFLFALTPPPNISRVQCFLSVFHM